MIGKYSWLCLILFLWGGSSLKVEEVEKSYLRLGNSFMEASFKEDIMREYLFLVKRKEISFVSFETKKNGNIFSFRIKSFLNNQILGEGKEVYIQNSTLS
jgi:hypothetical protein